MGKYFGRGDAKKRDKAGTFVGTPLYQPPEMLRDNQSGLFTDLWALGCILYELCTGETMFSGKTLNAIYNKIIE